MFQRLLMVIAAVLWAGMSPAQESPQAGIEATISSQIEAFQADDFATAFSFASPSIQGMFGSPERFGAMVRQGYPMVWRPADVQYLELREIAGALYQKVQITDQSGRIHLLDYRMAPGENGWKISGVQILKAPDVSV